MISPILRYLTIFLAIFMIAYLFISMSRPLDANPQKFKQGKTNSVLLFCGTAIDVWSKEHNRMPTTEEGLSVLHLKSDTPLDGWDRPIVYKKINQIRPNDSHSIHLVPKGKVDPSVKTIFT